MTGSELAAGMALLLAADPAPADASNGPVVVVLVAAGTVLGTIATALGPTFVEIAKNRGKKPVAETPGGPPAPAPVPVPPVLPASPGNALSAVVAPGIDALSLVDAAVQDYRRQRDAALRRADELQGRLEDAGRMIMDLRVRVSELEAEVRNPRASGRHAPYYAPDNRWSG